MMPCHLLRAPVPSQRARSGGSERGGKLEDERHRGGRIARRWRKGKGGEDRARMINRACRHHSRVDSTGGIGNSAKLEEKRRSKMRESERPREGLNHRRSRRRSSFSSHPLASPPFRYLERAEFRLVERQRGLAKRRVDLGG